MVIVQAWCILIYPPVTGQRQTLTIGWSAHFSLQWLLCAWRNSHLLRNVFLWSNVPVDFFVFLFAKFATCSKLPSRDNHCNVSYPWTQQCDHGAGWTQIIRSEPPENEAFDLLATLPTTSIKLFGWEKFCQISRHLLLKFLKNITFRYHMTKCDKNIRV